MNKSKECTVLAWKLRGSQGNLNSDFIAWFDESFQFLRNWIHCIAICLDKECVLRPVIIAVISESPLFDKGLLWNYLESISEILFHKSCIVDYFLLSFFSLASTFLLLGSSIYIDIKVGIGALDESWRLGRLPNLEHGVLVIFLNFTFLAEIEVWADTALVPNSSNWLNSAPITSNIAMNLSSLISCLLSEIVHHESLEGLSGVGFHFISHSFHQSLVEGIMK